jgi:selenoprotein W-related protein
MPHPPRIEIEYCTQCRWLLRAAWMAQELLTTFEQEIGEVALRPGAGGVFEVRIDGDTVWSQGRRPLSRHQGAEAARARPRRPR